MNRKILAVALAAIMVVAALPATIAMAQAQEGGVRTLTDVASPGSDVVFFINLTYLRNALGWVGSEVAIYLSGDGTAVIGDNDLKIVDFIYVAEDDYVAGTLRLPSATTLRDIVGDYDPQTDTGYLYIKVTDGRNVAVSTRILIVFNTNAFITVKGTKLADPYGPLETTNKFCYKVNLTTINQKLAVDGKDINFSRTDITYYLYVKFTNANSTVTAFYGEAQNNTLSNIASDLFTIDLAGTYAITNNTSGETLFRFNGTLKDFALPAGPILEESIKGILVNAVEFNIVFTIETDETEFLNGSVILIHNNQVVGKAPAGHNISVTPLSFGYEGTIEIYPSVAFANYTESGVTVADQANPNDQVTLILKHFPANAMILITIYRLSGDAYEPLVTINATDLYGAYTDANGTATVTIDLPEAPYGGLPYAFVATAGGVTGLPAINTTSNAIVNLPIYPYLEVYAFQDDGTPRYPAGGPTAWGDYLLVKGHGFLPEAVNLVAVSAATSAEIFDIIELAGISGNNITVLGNGTFIAIAKIPLDASNETFLVVGKGVTPSDSGKSTTTLYFELGEPTVQKVYVNPTPVIVNATYGYIELGLDPAYPFPAVWEDLTNRIFTLELIGFDATNFKNVSINITDGTLNRILEKGGEPLVNLTLTNGYLLIKDIEVPVIPYSNYSIKVYNSTAPGYYEMTYEPLIKIKPTAAFIDPLTGDYTKSVTIMAILDLNVTGYGWPANVEMQWDIVEYKMLGFENFSIVTISGTGANKTVTPVSTGANGYFTGVTQLSLYISALGTYHIQIHPKNQPDVNDILTVVIGQAPQLIVNVETAKTKVTGDHVDIWIQVLFDGEPANNTQVPGVEVTVYAMVNGGLVTIVNGALAEYVAEGLWYYGFSIDPAYKGYDLAVVVKAKGRYLPYLPQKTAYDIATLTVAGGLQDQLDAIQEQATAAAAGVAQLQEQVAALQTAVDAISAKLDQIQGSLNDIAGNVAAANDKLDQLAAAVNELSGKLDDLSNKMDQLQNNVQQTLDQFKTEVADTVGQASGTAKNWGIINAVLTILVLIVAIYLVTKKSP